MRLTLITNSKNQIRISFMERKIGVAVCLIALVTLFLSSCSKDTSEQKILGTWTLVDDPSCRWTFRHFDGENVYDWARNQCSIVVDTIRASCLFAIDNNTLVLSANGSSPSVYGNLSIDEFSNKKLRISGTILFHYYDYDYTPAIEHNDYVDIDYEFKKSK